MTDYKKIKLKLEKPLSQKEIDAINYLSKKNSKNNFYFEYNDKNIVFYLNSLDLGKFRNDLNLKNIKENSVLFDLLKEIEKIKSYGIKGGKRIYVEYDRERKIQNRQNKILQRGTYFYARGNTFTKEVNNPPKNFANKIIRGDSEEILKKLPSNCVDLVFTSPPYNFGLNYGTSEDGIEWNRYFDKLFAIFKECIRVLKYGGRIIVNIQPLFSDYIPVHHIISDFFMKNKLIWKGEILWEKHNYNCKYTAWGSWKSPSNPYLKYTWEFLEVFSKGDLKHIGESKNADITEGEFKEWVTAKWSIAPERKMKEFGHPAMFPEKLVERVIKLFSFENDVILDPFNGVGTTTKVAKQFNRRFIGIDISKEYTKTAKERLKGVSHQKTLKGV